MNAIAKSSEGISEIRTWVQSSSLLNDTERAEVINGTASIMECIPRIGKDRDTLARDLIAVRQILKPKRMWDRWLSFHTWERFGVSRATAHRVIDSYIDRRVLNPSPALKSGMLPPPQRLALKKPPATVSASGREIKGRWRGEISSYQAAAETFRAWRTRIGAVPAGERKDSLDRLVSAQLAYLGMSTPHTFHPAAVPTEWIRKKRAA
ncbi:MAG TPA: hypothetical protein VFW94_23875 [Candidatus Acidoferrales bacterium]|nr:hypothetical protein [Candidatus Acidoferrales bacterium]